MDRLENTTLNAQQSAIDIYKQFGYSKQVQTAILNGSMGKYGVTYKLTTQVIGNWIYRSKQKPKYQDAI